MNAAKVFAVVIASTVKRSLPTSVIITKGGINVMDDKKFRCARFLNKNGICYCSINAGSVPNDDKTDCKRTGCPMRLLEPIS